MQIGSICPISIYANWFSTSVSQRAGTCATCSSDSIASKLWSYPKKARSDPVTLMRMLPASIRHVHFLQQTFYVVEVSPDDPPRRFPYLESFTFTWRVPAAHIEYRAPDQEDSDSLTDLQRVIESNIVAPQCTFKYLRSTKSPESLLADALAAFNL